MWLLNVHVYRECPGGKASSELSLQQGPRQGRTGGRSPSITHVPDTAAPAVQPRTCSWWSRYIRAARRWLSWSSGMGILLQRSPPYVHPNPRSHRKASVALLARVRKEENSGRVGPMASERGRDRERGGTATSHLRQAPAGKRAKVRGKVCNPRIGDPAEVSSPAGSN